MPDAGWYQENRVPYIPMPEGWGFTGQNYKFSAFSAAHFVSGLSPQMTVYEVAVSEIGRARDNFVARLKAIDAACMEPASERDLRGIWDIVC